MEQQHAAAAILPASDLEESQAFFERLGFSLALLADPPILAVGQG